MFSRIPLFERLQPLQDPKQELALTQDAIARTLDSLLRRDWLHGELLQNSTGAILDVTLLAGIENFVEHGLGVPVRGWIIVDNTAQTDIWRIASPTGTGYKADAHLALSVSANTTVRLVVFS